MRDKRFLFCVKSSKKIGYGHLVRCINLAKEIKIYMGGAWDNVSFINPCDKKGAALLDLNSSYLHCQQHYESYYIPTDIDAVIFDRNKFDALDRDRLYSLKRNNFKGKVIQITESGLNQQGGIDAYIDASIKNEISYPPGEVVLDGPEYAILHPDFMKYNQMRKIYDPEIKKVLICLGGGATFLDLKKVISNLAPLKMAITVAPGFHLNHDQKLLLKILYPGLNILSPTGSLAKEYHKADLAVIGPGVSAFEAACTGAPALYVYHFDNNNQRSAAWEFEKNGIGFCLGYLEEIDKKLIEYDLNALTLSKRERMGKLGKQLVDGKGAEKIVEYLKDLLKKA